jgi:hypothetical protein
MLSLLSSSAWCAVKEPGGQGKIESKWAYKKTCFKPNSNVVLDVCTHYTINWKLWSLLGDPVGDYNVYWELTSIKLGNAKYGIAKDFTMESLPLELRDLVAKIELYIDAVAAVHTGGSNSGDGFLHFNTGVSVLANSGSSINTPESPNWNKLFVATGDACDEKLSNFMDTKLAKQKFINGIDLSDLRVCPDSGVSELTALESAISELCDKPVAEGRYDFCPEQKPKDKEAADNNSSAKSTDKRRWCINNDKAKKPLPQKLRAQLCLLDRKWAFLEPS